MPRKSAASTFLLNDFHRAIAAAKAEHLPIRAIETRHNLDGTRIVKVIVGEPTKDNGVADNPLDQWMTSHADQVEGH